MRLGPRCPRRSVAGPDRQRTELVEREAPVQVLGGDLLDPVQFRLLVRVGGLFPRAGALERDPTLTQDLSQPLASDPNGPDRVVGQIGGEFAQAPVCERLSELGRARGGRRDDEGDVVIRDRDGLPPTEGPARPSLCR